jgi:hypothetical protein
MMWKHPLGLVAVCCAIAVTAGCGGLGHTVDKVFGPVVGFDPNKPPPAGAVVGAVQSPPPGTRWTIRSVSYNENTSRTATKNVEWTALGDGVLQGRAVFRLSDGATVHVHDRATGSWLAVLDQSERELISYQPNDGTFVSPLWVGKEWVARYSRHDRMQRRSLNDLVTVWKVTAYEDVQVPAGRYKAFRVEAWPDDRDNVRKRTYWYAPDVRLIVRETTEGVGEPYAIGVGRDRLRSTAELVQYTAAGAPAPGSRAATPARQLTPAERAAEQVQTLAQDRDTAARGKAAAALGEVDPTLYAVAIPALSRAAGGDADPGVRTVAARMLNRLMLRTPQAGPALAEAARRSPEAVALLAEAALHPDLKLRAIDLLGKVGPPAASGLGILREMMSDREATVRTAAATAIGQVGATAEEVDLLVRALRDPERAVQDAAATSLTPRAADVLRRLTPDLADPTPEIRRHATEALGSLAAVAPTDVVTHLRNALEDRDRLVRAAGARGLGRAGETGLGALREALRHDDPAVRAAAADAIATVPSARVVNAAALTLLLDDADETVRVHAIRALTTLGPDARSAAPALKRLSERDASAEVRFLAQQALTAVGQ